MISAPFKVFALFGIFMVLIACTNSDDYLFNNRDSQEIEVSAVITTSFDNDSEKKKTDTIQPGDSLIFLTTVYPSKSIRNKQYYWTIDGFNFASEYSFKKSIIDPGVHKIAFVFVDFFGDTLSDTLTVTVASPPIIDTENFIPATATQQIDPDSVIRFAWNSYDPDSLWDVSFRFVLQDNDKDTLIDTLLKQSYFTSRKKLSPLQKYTWTVTALNEFNLQSKDFLKASFFTSSRKGESAILGVVSTSAVQEEQDFKVILLDSLQVPLDTLNLSGSSADFNIQHCTKGRYTLITSVENASDFKTDTIHFDLYANRVLELDSIILLDRTLPRIQSPTETDTIDIADTLRIIVYDNGGVIPASKISVYYENKNRDFIYSNDTLYIPFEKEASAQNWSPKIMTVTAADPSNNRVKQIFYLRPNASLSEVFDE